MEESLRLQLKVTGTVQGVGFRPFIYRVAREESLGGWVRNDTAGVTLEVEGKKAHLNRFIKRMLAERPPLSSIESYVINNTEVLGENSFVVGESIINSPRQTRISPDVAVCPDCLRELFDPGDRRYRYPFINCTNCGPRFTIIKDIPYDRANTTMAPFEMCPQCREEYINSDNRRFHAEPNACPVCGPQVKLLDAQGREVSKEPVWEAVKILKAGAILAVKGLGGYHLACDATNEESVRRLRGKKVREDKPLAIMARDIAAVEKFCLLRPKEKELLLDRKRPIVLLDKKPNHFIASSVALKASTFGVMLPYTPLHHLLLEEFPCGLVMTSGNHSSEPILYRDYEAMAKLKGIADYFLIHNRAIFQRCDDSVTRVFRGRELVLRRSRGYTPDPVKLPFSTCEILACGAEQKNTFCLAKGEQAYLSHHLGDLTNEEGLIAFEEGIKHFLQTFAIKPKIIACDMHPDYLSTKYALECEGLKCHRIQHHHAHIASCMGENGLMEPVLGLSFDGTGYGTDGTLWGGEFLVCTYGEFERAGHLRYVPMVSGEKAIKEPWRMAAVYLREAYGRDFLALPLAFIGEMDRSTWAMLEISRQKGLNAPLTSSMGRFFDAVAALLGVCLKVSYEGQAAIELETIANPHVTGGYNYGLEDKNGSFVIDTVPVIRGIVDDLANGVSRPVIAGKFHHTVADFSLQGCCLLRKKKRINDVALSGGVFQNTLLLGKICDLLQAEGFKVYTHSKVPPNDGGISLGQALIAHERSKNNVPGHTGESA